eukprot:TRINITY_DN2823_c0_g1_i2.p1 TRINITY_DN2823_c0_g1~~TRINITY_DN2823_c0_g1_i2.p1  ORF type:complete len:191 (-),score=5.59 TRINITY_DN2823_c0_g1_i2:260-793(-)
MEKRKVVIGLGGAFNPIHTQHELTLILAKQFLENELHYEVLCAYFAVATDGYLKNKMAKANQKAITSKHRLAMCELISRESPFIKTTYKPFGSAFECIKTLHAKELHVRHPLTPPLANLPRRSPSALSWAQTEPSRREASANGESQPRTTSSPSASAAQGRPDRSKSCTSRTSGPTE